MKRRREADRVIQYWIGGETDDPARFRERRKLWYDAGRETDEFIRARFGGALTAAESGELDHWSESTRGALALVILLDQFSRNLYRGRPEAYRNDARAQAITQDVIGRGADRGLHVPARILLYHPLLHAENTDLQRRAVCLFEQLTADSGPEWREAIGEHQRFVRNHCRIIEQFGRFPHRNRILGRPSSPDELAYLARNESSYGQE